jgi:O-antigen ligase
MQVAIIFFLGLSILSFFWWPWAAVPFEVPKVVAFNVFVKLLFVLFIYDLYKRPNNLNKWILNKKLISVLMLFLAWSLITAFLGSDISKSFLGNYYRRDGLLTLFDLTIFSLLISYFWRENFKKVVASAIFVASFLLGLWSITLIFTGNFELGNAATFGNPVFLAGYLAVGLPFSYYYLKSLQYKFKLLFLAPQIVAILTIGAVSAILTMGLWFLMTFYTQSKSKIKFVILQTALFILVFIASWWSFDYIYTNNRVLIAEGRLRIFANLTQAIVKRPLTGYGWSNVDYAFKEGSWPIKLNNDVYVDKAHSQLLEVLTTTGAIGLGIYIMLLTVMLRQLIKKYKQSRSMWDFTILSVFILYLFHAQTNVISITEEMLFWFVVGTSIRPFVSLSGSNFLSSVRIRPSVFEESLIRLVSRGQKSKPTL